MAEGQDPHGIERYRGVLAGKVIDTARCNVPGCGKYVSPAWNDVCNEHEIERIDQYKGPEREMWLVVTQVFHDAIETTWEYVTHYTPAHSYDEAWQRAYAAIKRNRDIDAIPSMRAIVVERIPIHGDWTIDGADFHFTCRLDRDTIYPDDVVAPHSDGELTK